MDYKKTVLRQDMCVDDVISVHYFEYAVDFSFSGELHDFWEFIYADKSELVITADTNEIILPQGSMYVHKPMEFHNVRGNGTNAPNSVIVTFSSSTPELFDVAGKVMVCNEHEKACMASVIEAGREAFSSPLGDPYTEELVRKENSPFGAEQLIELNLEMLFISLIRRYGLQSAAHADQPTPNARRRKDEIRLRQICEYMLENVEKDLTSKDLQKKFFISESSLQKLFQHKVGCGAMQHFQRMKIDRAKEMIREKKLNFSEIAQRLSFSSIHYFSRRFKAVSGMTPSEFADSVNSFSFPKK